MKTVLRALKEILEEAPNHQLLLTDVEMELTRSEVLGFGVEPIDVIHFGVMRGVVSYDPKNQIVTLLLKK